MRRLIAGSVLGFLILILLTLGCGKETAVESPVAPPPSSAPVESELPSPEVPGATGPVLPADPPPPPRTVPGGGGTFVDVDQNPVAALPLEAGSGSYADIRRYLLEGKLPPVEMVRIEELINYFSYDDPKPFGTHPISVTAEVGPCPWRPEHRLARIGLRTVALPPSDQPPANLVFLLDVSASMERPGRLPLLKRALWPFVRGLSGKDRIAVVVYAGASGLVLPSTPGGAENTNRILNAFESLGAGGTSAGERGVRLAYSVAGENRVFGGINRVILVTDGNYNLGIDSKTELIRFIREMAAGGISLTVMGFGEEDLEDAPYEDLASVGGGRYIHIDSLKEAERALGDQLIDPATPAARDVTVALSFNARQVDAYRLLGYETGPAFGAGGSPETRKDLPSGHRVTVLYELRPVEGGLQRGRGAGAPEEVFTVAVRSRSVGDGADRALNMAIQDMGARLDGMSPDFKLASAAGAFGLVLGRVPDRGIAGYDLVLDLAGSADHPDRGELTEMARRALRLSR